ncbi:protein TolR [Terasakiella brassicae]|uniref:Protein TolR n=1 Tax=Terasakiella brassicae TaxID=1634917 RepID=A0A917C2G4_9PROT|nr:biopolymer transporter ExbD [Terasakiella brassicae]GGF69051.1 protein TolR [Terasakiella brassicae]
MALGGNGSDPDQPLSEINVTPLVDVMLVLLVIFIVAAPIMSQALRVNLPKANGTPENEPIVASLIVRTNNQFELDGVIYHKADLLNALKAVKESKGEKMVVQLGADADLPYQLVADALSELKKADISRISFATASPN